MFDFFIISYNNTLYGKANNIKFKENNIITIKLGEEEKYIKQIQSIRDEFNLLYSEEKYDDCANILSKTNTSGLIVLLTNTQNCTEEQIELTVSNYLNIFDMFNSIGWDKVKWTDERIDILYKCVFVFPYQSEENRECFERKVFVENYLKDYEGIPEALKNMIVLDETDENKAETYKVYFLREKAFDDAIYVLKKYLYSPSSLEVHYNNCSTNFLIDRGIIKVKLDYSAMNKYGGMVRKSYNYDYNIPSMYIW